MGMRRSLAIALLSTALAAACQPATIRATTEAPRPASAIDYDALVRARQDSLRTRCTAADARFMTGMIGHHAQALVMAALAPTNGASASVRILAARIINAQKDEIGLMQAWLRDRRQPVPHVSAPGAAGVTAPAAMDHDMAGMQHDMGDHPMMPGMLTNAQLAELAQARGADFDRLFLTYMIQHHKGAVVMVNALFSTDGAGQDEIVFKFASDVQVDQSTEIARMERMLASLGSR